MADFLTDEWITELDDAVQSSEKLKAVSEGRSLVVQQCVTDTPSGDIFWHIVFDDGHVRVRPGPAESPDITFSQNLDTAVAVVTAQKSAQTAFMTGKLRIGGTVGRLIENRELFTEVSDLFSDVYANTTH